MALTPDEFYRHALAAADSEGRLPLSRMTGWDISPFEQEGLRVAPLRPPVLPEPARHGEDPSDCRACRSRDEGIWFNDRWRLTRMPGVGVPLVLMLHPRDHYDMGDLPDELAGELGVLSAHLVRHVEALPHISRAHVYRIGDGGAHLHVWFFARPAGQAQLYGSWMVVWDDLLPEYPAEVADADAATVADALVASYGGRRSPAAGGGFEIQPGDTTFRPGVLRDPTSRVRIASKVMKTGRRPDNDIIITDPSVSEQHAELRTSPTGRIQIIDLGSHNGTFVNGTRVNQQELKEGDIIAIGHATFRLIGGELIEYLDDGRATFEAHELQVVVHDGGRDKVLLDGITFPLAERSMMAVIGPTGAGKSTLLNALTGRYQATAGSVLYDHRDLYENYEELKPSVGLVPQESVTHDNLTPKAALGFQAQLRLPPDIKEADRDRRVAEVLDMLSLSQHADTRIDRLSGSHRKQFDIGMELLSTPSLLFLDNPTAPLDPYLKRGIFRLLRRMADQNARYGTTVVVFTTDVDPKLIGLCDRLLVLQMGGKMAYFGPPADGLRYFGRDDWADVFQAFADEPERDFAAEFRASPDFVKYVATPISVHKSRAPGHGSPS